MKLILIALFAGFAMADTPPVPKIFKGMQGQKGQYQVEILESTAGGGKAGGGRPRKMTICTDNLMKPPAEGAKGADPGCKYRLLKDTADEAVVESACKDRASTITMKRENAKSLLMSMQSSGPRGPTSMKMRYTHLGACREGQGAVTLDPNSEQCRKMKERAAKMDPETAARLKAMCG